MCEPPRFLCGTDIEYVSREKGGRAGNQTQEVFSFEVVPENLLRPPFRSNRIALSHHPIFSMT